MTDLGAPSLLGSSFIQPLAPSLSSASVSHGAVAGGLIDGGTDGAAISAQHSGGGVAEFLVKGGTARAT